MLAEAGDDVNPRSAHMCQMFILRRDQGRLEEARVLPEAAVNKTPGLLTFRAMIALADAELGRTAEARRELDDLAVGGFARINRDFTWTASLSTLTGLCDALEDRDRAAQLLELFRPHAGHLVVMGWGDVCPGAVDRYLAILADVCGQLDQAERLFESALALEARLGSPPSLVRTRSRFARMLLHRDGPGDRPRARELAAAAEVAARQCGMATIADDAHQLALTL
jgi:tetratricopeptide (TPR) repeat protein